MSEMRDVGDIVEQYLVDHGYDTVRGHYRMGREGFAAEAQEPGMFLVPEHACFT